MKLIFQYFEGQTVHKAWLHCVHSARVVKCSYILELLNGLFVSIVMKREAAICFFFFFLYISMGVCEDRRLNFIHLAFVVRQLVTLVIRPLIQIRYETGKKINECN